MKINNASHRLAILVAIDELCGRDVNRVSCYLFGGALIVYMFQMILDLCLVSYFTKKILILSVYTWYSLLKYIYSRLLLLFLAQLECFIYLSEYIF